MPSHVETHSLSRHLRELEESMLESDVRKSEAMLELLADDFVEFGSSGRTYTKAELVALLQAETPSVQRTSDFKVALLSPEVGLITYVIRREGEPPVYSLRSSVWQLRGERWQLIFHQGTVTVAPE